MKHSRTQSGQATVEYVFVLFISVWIFVAVIKGILLPAFGVFQSKLSTQINSMGNNLHTLPFGH